MTWYSYLLKPLPSTFPKACAVFDRFPEALILFLASEPLYCARSYWTRVFSSPSVVSILVNFAYKSSLSSMTFPHLFNFLFIVLVPLYDIRHGCEDQERLLAKYLIQRRVAVLAIAHHEREESNVISAFIICRNFSIFCFHVIFSSIRIRLPEERREAFNDLTNNLCTKGTTEMQ